jgi:FKBP-type peptidyl-prolyl cis-trans isomerase FkpA
MSRVLTALPALLAAATLALSAQAAEAPRAAAPAAIAPAAAVPAAKATGPQTDEDKQLYALGVLMARNLKDFALTKQEAVQVRAGFAAAVAGGKPAFEPEAFMPQLNALHTARVGAVSVRNKAAGQAARDQAAKLADTQTLPSGVVMTQLKAGTGASPKATDTVKVHYEGKLLDGTVFDSSVQRGQPASFPLSGVVPCWTEALQHIKVGGKSRVWCPSDVAYGDSGRGPIPGGATLVFEVELLEIAAAAPAPPAPAAAPAAPATPGAN